MTTEEYNVILGEIKYSRNNIIVPKTEKLLEIIGVMMVKIQELEIQVERSKYRCLSDSLDYR